MLLWIDRLLIYVSIAEKGNLTARRWHVVVSSLLRPRRNIYDRSLINLDKTNLMDNDIEIKYKQVSQHAMWTSVEMKIIGLCNLKFKNLNTSLVSR